MKRSLAVAVAAVAVLAGCGTDTCTSNPAKLDANLSSANCSNVRAGSSVTISVPLCSRCNDSAPGCQAEVIGSRIELAPVVQQCQEQQGCAASGCNAAAQRSSCTFTTPATANTYDLVVVGDGNSIVQGTLTTTSNGGTACTL